jgi:hypothetical protein
MRSKIRVLSAVIGLSMLGAPVGAMAAAVQLDRSAVESTSMWQASPQHSPIVLADWWDDWNHHHHQDQDHRWNPNDYKWGGQHRYQYAPAWFNPPPHEWADDRRRAYLLQRRQVAITMQREMWAKGDTNAANRLGAVIAQLDSELGHR